MAGTWAMEPYNPQSRSLLQTRNVSCFRFLSLTGRRSLRAILSRSRPRSDWSISRVTQSNSVQPTPPLCFADHGSRDISAGFRSVFWALSVPRNLGESHPPSVYRAFLLREASSPWQKDNIYELRLGLNEKTRRQWVKAGSSMNRIAVIGAGPAGLTAAYQLTKRIGDVAVFEASSCVGGLARSMSLWNQIVDLGPHRFFSHDRRVNELWLEVVGRDYAMVKRQTRILYDGKLFKYPLEGLDVLQKLGAWEAMRCLYSYAQEWGSPTRLDGSFQNWVCQRFGRRLFEIFFQKYSEKLWGISCTELDADFPAQRIKKFSLSVAVKSALFYNTGKNHRTLADEFAYPTGGTGTVYQRMAEAVQQRGGQVRLKTPVLKVLTENRKVIGLKMASGAVACDRVISTMPLTVMVLQLDGVPPEVTAACAQLQFRNTILVYVEVLDGNPWPDNWIYVHSPDLRF